MNDTLRPLFSEENVAEAERVVSSALKAAIKKDNVALNTALAQISERFAWCISSPDTIGVLIGGTQNPLISRVAALNAQIKSIQTIFHEPRY